MAGSGIKKYWKIFTGLGAGMNAVATIWTFLIMFLMTGDVIGRVVFSNPIRGTSEIVKVSLVGILFMQVPYTLWKNRHVRCDMLLMRLSPIVKEIVQVFVFIFGAIIFAAIFASSWADTIYAWKIFEYEGEGALRVPVYPIRSLILLGSALTTIYFIALLVRSISTVLKEYRTRS